MPQTTKFPASESRTRSGPPSYILDSSRDWRRCDGCTTANLDPPFLKFNSRHFYRAIDSARAKRRQVYWIGGHQACYETVLATVKSGYNIDDGRLLTRWNSSIFFQCSRCTCATNVGQRCVGERSRLQRPTGDPRLNDFLCGSCIADQIPPRSTRFTRRSQTLHSSEMMVYFTQGNNVIPMNQESVPMPEGDIVACPNYDFRNTPETTQMSVSNEQELQRGQRNTAHMMEQHRNEDWYSCNPDNTLCWEPMREADMSTMPATTHFEHEGVLYYLDGGSVAASFTVDDLKAWELHGKEWIYKGGLI
jgi:hypothetical protein